MVVAAYGPRAGGRAVIDPAAGSISPFINESGEPLDWHHQVLASLELRTRYQQAPLHLARRRPDDRPARRLPVHRRGQQQHPLSAASDRRAPQHLRRHLERRRFSRRLSHRRLQQPGRIRRGHLLPQRLPYRPAHRPGPRAPIRQQHRADGRCSHGPSLSQRHQRRWRHERAVHGAGRALFIVWSKTLQAAWVSGTKFCKNNVLC